MKTIGFRKKRVLAGLVMLAVAVALGFLLKDFTGPDSRMWQRLVFIVAVLGTGVAGLLCNFLGLWGILYGFGLIAAIGILNVLPRVLPEPWNRYFSFALLIFFFGWSANTKYQKKKNKKQTKKEKKTEKEPGFAKQTILLAYGMVNGNHYQLLRSAGEIRAYFLGGELKGIDENLIQDPNQPLRPVGKKDIAIPIDKVQSVKYKEYSGNSAAECAFVLHAGRKYRFCPLDPEDIPNFMSFFQRWIHTAQTTQKTSLKTNRLEILRKVHYGFGAYILVVSLCWMFLDVPYRLFSVLSMIGFPALMILYAIFPDYFTLLEKTRSTKNISMVSTAFGACFAVLLRTLMDFNILQWGRLLLLCGIGFVICTIALMLLTKEWKQKKQVLLHFLLMLLFYLPGTLGQINCAFDYHDAQVYQAQVTELSISTSSKAPDSYHVDVLLMDGSKLELETSPEHYASLSVGDSVDVLRRNGTLGVAHAYLD